MARSTTPLIGLGAAALLVLTGCSTGSDGTPDEQGSASGYGSEGAERAEEAHGEHESGTESVPELGTTENDVLGSLITDGNGNTLYLFTEDTDRSSACVGECAETWPPLRTADGAGSAARVGGGLSADLVGSIPREDGGPQVTYDGRPLYTYAGDAAPGDVNGQAVGDTWYAVSAAGGPAGATAGGGSGGDRVRRSGD